jgi:hypothetical protein
VALLRECIIKRRRRRKKKKSSKSSIPRESEGKVEMRILITILRGRDA